MANEMHKDFQQRLSKSETAVLIVRHWLDLCGYVTKQEKIEIPELPGYNPSDEGDIQLTMPNLVTFTVEVKHRTDVHFTEEWPFKDMWLIGPNEYEKKMESSHPIHAFVALSDDYKHAAVYLTKRDCMFMTMDFDKKRGTSVPKLAVKREALEYYPVPADAIEKGLKNMEVGSGK